jgi:hypothetical protein
MSVEAFQSLAMAMLATLGGGEMSLLAPLAWAKLSLLAPLAWAMGTLRNKWKGGVLVRRTEATLRAVASRKDRSSMSPASHSFLKRWVRAFDISSVVGLGRWFT